MALCETPDLSETLDILTPSEARQLAARWRREGARDIFSNDGARLLCVAEYLRDCAERADQSPVRRTFEEEACETARRGHKELQHEQQPGSIEGGPIACLR